METIIKNIHLISQLDDLELQKLAHGALQHQKFSRITFKILSIDDKAIKVQTVQGKSPHSNEADEKTLIERTKELFSKFFPNLKIIVNAVIYHPSPVEVVNPVFIRKIMTHLKIKVKDIVNDTCIDKTNVSAWINGTRDMSQPVKAMFYYYLINHVDNSKWQDFNKLPKPSGLYLVKTKYGLVDVVRIGYPLGNSPHLYKTDDSGWYKDYNEHSVITDFQKLDSVEQ